jgi:hypothetical protein
MAKKISVFFAPEGNTGKTVTYALVTSFLNNFFVSLTTFFRGI